jgi:peptide/nickel transport system substrate-binding protein
VVGTDRRARHRLLALLLAVLLIGAACGGDDDSGGSGGTDDGVTPGTDEDAGKPTPGGEVVYGLEAETNGGFCLQEAQLAIGGIQVARTIYDTLTAPNADGEIEPFLAESVEPNDDFTVWTIKLREGIKFHDGTTLDAQLVKDNLDAYRGVYPARTPLLFIFNFAPVSDIAVVDPLTVTVTTKVPWVAFPWQLWSSARAGIVGRSQLDAPDADCANKLVGTGPFKLDHWTVNQEFVAVKNPDYWVKDADGVQLPYLDKITYKPINEVAQRVNALESGQIQAMHTSDTEQLADRLRPLKEDGKIAILESDSFGEVNYLMLNSSKPPFDNKNARLAFAHALDRQLLIDVRGGGIGTVANGPFAKDVLGYTEDTGFPEFDIEKSKEFQAAYEADTGQKLTFTYSFVTGESGNLTAQEIQKQLQDAGITINIDSTGDQATAINKAIAGDFQSIGWRNHPGADPDTQYIWWYAGGPVNFGRINDPEINALLDKGRSDATDREKTYQDLNKRFGSEAYNIWTSFTIWSVATDPKVHNLLGNDLPAGGKPATGLGTGHPVSGIWIEQ